MGASGSSQEKKEPENKFGKSNAPEIKLDLKNLPKLEKTIDLPKAPEIKTRK